MKYFPTTAIQNLAVNSTDNGAIPVYCLESRENSVSQYEKASRK